MQRQPGSMLHNRLVEGRQRKRRTIRTFLRGHRSGRYVPRQMKLLAQVLNTAPVHEETLVSATILGEGTTRTGSGATIIIELGGGCGVAVAWGGYTSSASVNHEVEAEKSGLEAIELETHDARLSIGALLDFFFFFFFSSVEGGGECGEDATGEAGGKCGEDVTGKPVAKALSA